jgi:hypothetical protein
MEVMSVNYQYYPSVSIVSDYRLDDRASAVRSPAGAKDSFSLYFVSRAALRPAQPPIKWEPGVLSAGVKRGQDMTVTTHPSSAEVKNE